MNEWRFVEYSDFFVRERAISFAASPLFLFFLFLSPFSSFSSFIRIFEVDGPVSQSKNFLSSRLKMVKTEEVGVSRSRRRAARVLEISYL